MAKYSSIEWTEVTWNPVTGCSKVSAGCKFCYAERMAKRLQAMGVEQYKDGFKLKLAPKVLKHPFSWKTPRTVFVNSMSDLFHKDVPLSYIQEVFKVMNETPRHTYQVLTKRSDRLQEIAHKLNWSSNIWMGVSVEEEKVSYRIPELLSTPAKVKFLSIEPLIGSVQSLYLEGIDWVIVGGESGPGARPLRKEWVLNIFRQCRTNKVKFFFKQWGSPNFNANPQDPTMNKDHENYAKGGCQLNGRVYREMPATGAYF
ncbi:MAG TPA: phage Gp37/Gp68 family protein [Oligoflexia bacterium]|nr:phage Gp37/Gp68 family protein [Oligoflexia bacterium]HMP49434.1 phage Gp37/Gp68 family protein [Oligoflexia bacterium]